MIIDKETNFLYLADCLPIKFPVFFKEFEKAILSSGIKFDLLPKTTDIWAVDYMPFQLDTNRFVKFKYNPSYLAGDKWQKTITNTEFICNHYKLDCKTSNLVVDGGNIVKEKNKVIMCDQVFRENPLLSKQEVISELKDTLEVEEIIFRPKEPGDSIGHADGMIRFLNSKTALINNLTKANKKFRNDFHAVLKNANLDFIEIPYNPYGNKKYIQANGIYNNYLQLDGVIFLAVFDLPEDNDVIKLFESLFTGVKIVPVMSNDIANEGGVLNCISWNIKK